MSTEKLLTDGTVEECRNKDGSKRLAVRAPSGMFCKKETATKEEAAAATLAKLVETDIDGDSHLERILDRAIASATLDPEQPVYDKHGNQVGTAIDSRLILASTKAAQLCIRAAGLEQPEKQPVQQNKVSIVNLTLPPEVLDVILKRQGRV